MPTRAGNSARSRFPPSGTGAAAGVRSPGVRPRDSRAGNTGRPRRAIFSRAVAWPVSVTVEIRIGRCGNRCRRAFTSGTAAMTSPTDTACSHNGRTPLQRRDYFRGNMSKALTEAGTVLGVSGAIWRQNTAGAATDAKISRVIIEQVHREFRGPMRVPQNRSSPQPSPEGQGLCERVARVTSSLSLRSLPSSSCRFCSSTAASASGRHHHGLAIGHHDATAGQGQEKAIPTLKFDLPTRPDRHRNNRHLGQTCQSDDARSALDDAVHEDHRGQ